MRKYTFLIGFVIGNIAYHVPDFLGNEFFSDRPFHAYVDEHPVRWIPNAVLCLEIQQKKSFVNQEKVFRKSLNEFSSLTGISYSRNCLNHNVLIAIDTREHLSYLKTNRAIGASTYKFDPAIPLDILGGRIELDLNFLKNASEKSIELLILHELGHVIGLAHTRDGGIMEADIDDAHSLRFISEAAEHPEFL